ncbi:hypothetical protein B296_00054083, partial [Ensete ventricosum]
ATISSTTSTDASTSSATTSTEVSTNSSSFNSTASVNAFIGSTYTATSPSTNSTAAATLPPLVGGKCSHPSCSASSLPFPHSHSRHTSKPSEAISCRANAGSEENVCTQNEMEGCINRRFPPLLLVAK